ncbi:MAG TPA: hypothetical protein VFO23_04695 [Steroidobacteraceae bacterium]|nr:hypothetical protein [Steroidobacteraceae bacterium]
MATVPEQPGEALDVGEELRGADGRATAVGDDRVGGAVCDQRQRGQMATSSCAR